MDSRVKQEMPKKGRCDQGPLRTGCPSLYASMQLHHLHSKLVNPATGSEHDSDAGNGPFERGTRNSREISAKFAGRIFLALKG
jgi:hypothetical protein